MKLISIHLPSNKPFHFRRLVENLVATAADPDCFEVVVKIDIGDEAMRETIEEIQRNTKVNLNVVVSERPASYFHTYIACNEALQVSDPEYYFCWHTNDEILIETKHWDRILERYVGFFPDHIFRLKVNPKKMLYNFFDIHEVCLYADYPIVPRKWLEGTEVWAECHGPDTYQEGIAIYLAKYGYHRNVPLLDVVVGGDEAGENLSPERLLARAQGTCIAWDFSLTAKMQERFARAARRLQLMIMAHELKLPSYELREDAEYKSVTLVHGDRAIARVYYPIDYVAVTLAHFDHIARRRLDVWPYSLLGKSLPFRLAAHAYRVVRPIAVGTWAAVKIPIGLLLGFRIRALFAAFVDTQLARYRYPFDKLIHHLATNFPRTRAVYRNFRNVGRTPVSKFLAKRSELGTRFPRLAAVYRRVRGWWRAVS